LEPIGSFLRNQDGSVVDLTGGATVAFRMVAISDGTVRINNVAATILDVATAKVQYSPTGSQMDITAGLTTETFAMYWLVSKSGQATIRVPYDGARFQLVLKKETVAA
jgi:hypothetical protein